LISLTLILANVLICGGPPPCCDSRFLLIIKLLLWRSFVQIKSVKSDAWSLRSSSADLLLGLAPRILAKTTDEELLIFLNSESYVLSQMHKQYAYTFIASSALKLKEVQLFYLSLVRNVVI